MERKQLAEAGQEQLMQMLKTSKALLDAYSNLQPTAESQQKLQELHQSYIQLVQDVRQTLQQCQALEQQEAAAAAALQAGQAEGPEEQHMQQLEARAAELRQQLERQNQLIKAAIDKLRHLVDAFGMWDSHERHLVLNSVQYAMSGLGSM